MKRVQALVSGKKKQCTKLPKPAAQKDKKGSGSSEPSSPASPRSITVDKGVAEDGPETAIPASGRTNLPSSSSTASDNSTGALGASSRGVSKIPASSPKKSSKDGGGGTVMSKGRQSTGSEKAPKSKTFGRKLSKEKQKTDRGSGKAGQQQDKGEPVMAGSDDPAYVRHNRHAELSLDESGGGKDGSGKASNDRKSLSSAPGDETNNNETKIQEDQTKHDSQIEPILDVEANRKSDENGTSSEKAHCNINNKNINQDQGQKPLHGILKDSVNNGFTQNTNVNSYNEGSEQIVRHPHIRSAKGESRIGGSRINEELQYIQTYGSLPRHPKRAASVTNNAYAYGSLPRRPVLSSQTNQQVPYSTAHGWTPLTRKAESDWGFAVSNTDRTYSSSPYGAPDYSNKNYARIGTGYQPQRSGNADPGYLTTRAGGAPCHYFSDTESGKYPDEHLMYSRGVRAGSVPLGYESESGIYGTSRPLHPRLVSAPRNYEPTTVCGSGSSSSLRVHPDDERYRIVDGKRPIPRRHTVGVPGNRADGKDPETERKREAFLHVLAQRYPQYADRIQGVGSSLDARENVRPSRSRDVQRRRTAAVTYDPGRNLDYDDLGTMSDLEISTIQRGGFMRQSLPIVRSASASLERPLGLVFLVYGDQTKKSVLPNEITSLDTVRALFVRAFHDLTLEMLENPRKKVYLLDPATNIYFQLEDLAEIKDRSVLKIHDTDNDQPQKVKEKQEVRGRTVQLQAPKPHSRQVYDLPIPHNEVMKGQSLPAHTAYNYQELLQDQQNQWELERRSRSRTPEPVERSRSLSVGASSRQRFTHSPDRLPTPERISLNPIPENRQIPLSYHDNGNFYENTGMYRGQHPSGIYDSVVPYQGYSSPLTSQQAYVARSTRVPALAHPQRALVGGLDIRDTARGSNAGHHSLPFAPASMAQAPSPDAGFQRSHSYRIPTAERDGKDLSRSHSVAPADNTARNRIEKMEQQLANLTAWVHYQKDGTRRETAVPPRSASTTSDSSDTFPASSASSLSDIQDGFSNKRSSELSSRESTPLSAHAEVTAKLVLLKSDLHVLRRQHQLNMEAMKDEFKATFSKIKKVLSSLPGSDNQVTNKKQNEASITKGRYVSDKLQVSKELCDLEASVDELRNDVISRHSRVNTANIEDLSLLLSKATKSLTSLKAQFPEVYSQLKGVLDEELKAVVSEEKFLKDEPMEIENSLKRCTKISDTLSSITRLATAQEQNPPCVLNTGPSAGVYEHKKGQLDSAYTEHSEPVKETKGPAGSVDSKRINSHQDEVKFCRSIEVVSVCQQPSSQSVANSKDKGGSKTEGKTRQQTDQVKCVAPSKDVISSTVTTAAVSSPATSSSTSATFSHVPQTSSGSNVASIKPSFSVPVPASKPSVPASKPLEKPTATVSAMTAGVSDTTATKTFEKDPSPPVMKNVFIPLTQTTGRLTNTVLGPADIGTPPQKPRTESFKKKDPTVYTYKVCGPVSPVFPIPPDFSSPENMDFSPKTSPKDINDNSHSEKSRPELGSNYINKSGTTSPKSESSKKGSVSFSDPPVTFSASSDHEPVSGNVNGHAEKVGLSIQKQAARNAFFSSLNSPPNSPLINNRNSASLDQGPVISPSGQTETENSTINLVLMGSVSPMSPTSPGLFNIAPPSELSSVERKSLISPTDSTAQDPHTPAAEHNSFDSSTSSDSGSKQKKVPPPPPPRKGSRPTSASSPVNGGPPDLIVQQLRDKPRFVGGILGQHRLSGGPLSSTPKPILQHTTFLGSEQDNSSGIYFNMNRSNVTHQNNFCQSGLSESANSAASGNGKVVIPPPPSVTIPLDRDGSGNESTSSSSGTLGSQHSLASVIRSSSIKGSNKSKPDPPKRHSSLLAKLTGSRESKNKMNNGKAKVNGVDF